MSKVNIKDRFVGLKELRENMEDFIGEINKGKSFTVIRRSEPVFKIAPVDEDESLWESVVDFTKIKKGGIEINKILSRL
jgi:antitoxin (DNA-binding transcriptional repressor) of toxin-antitoxin stability system